MVFLYYFPWNDFYICTDPCVRLDRLIIIKIIGWFSRGLYGIDSNFEILISIYIIRCLGRCYVTVDLYMKITYAIGVCARRRCAPPAIRSSTSTTRLPPATRGRSPTSSFRSSPTEAEHPSASRKAAASGESLVCTRHAIRFPHVVPIQRAEPPLPRPAAEKIPVSSP